MKPAEFTGKTFGYVLVESYAGSKVIGKNTRRSVWNCKCLLCGKMFQSTTADLNSGRIVSCGCKKHFNGISKRKIAIGDVYNFLKVEELVGKNKEGRLLYRCVCLRCGNGEITTTGKQLRSGTTKSCGCLKKDRMSHFGDTNFRDLTGQIVGYLKVISRAPTKYSQAGNQSTMWNCKCLLCGNETTVSTSALTVKNHTRSCGCLRMSYAEYDIQNELTRLNINYIFDYSFSDLLSPNSHMPLRFDFALFDSDNRLVGLIEYQGEQHYKDFGNGFGDLQRNVTDPMKKAYCSERQIKLFEIKYNEDIIRALHKILNNIYYISYDNPVPSKQESA